MNHVRRATTLPTVALRAAALGATLCVLVATSAPRECEDWSAPVTLLAQGTCGTGGIVVVSVSEWSSSMTIANRAALGLPQNAQANYTAGLCPRTVGKGGWKVLFGESADASCPGDAATANLTCTTTCTVDSVVTGPLHFRCTDGAGAPVCESTLTVIQ